jgi:hypothetical protein
VGQTTLTCGGGQKTRVALGQLAIEFYTGFFAQKTAGFSAEKRGRDAGKKTFVFLPAQWQLM